MKWMSKLYSMQRKIGMTTSRGPRNTEPDLFFTIVIEKDPRRGAVLMGNIFCEQNRP